MDLFVVPTIGFRMLYAFVMVRLDRRHLVWISVTANPTAEWVAQQITEAFPWDGAPKHLIRDQDGIYGTAVTQRVKAMGILDRPIAAASPWQNGYAERLIRSIRRECLDHVIVFGEAHLRRVLRDYSIIHAGPLVAGQGRALVAAGSAHWKNCFTPDPWRASSSLRADLGFRYRQP